MTLVTFACLLIVGNARSQTLNHISDFTADLDLRSIQLGEIDPKQIDPIRKCIDVKANREKIEAESMAAKNKQNGRLEFTEGQDAPACAFPDIVKISFSPKVNWKPVVCSGVRVAPGMVLTAAHCSCGYLRSYEFHLNQNVPVDVRNRKLRKAEPEYTHELAWPPVRYANYNCALPARLQPGRDLAIMFLKPKPDVVVNNALPAFRCKLPDTTLSSKAEKTNSSDENTTKALKGDRKSMATSAAQPDNPTEFVKGVVNSGKETDIAGGVARRLDCVPTNNGRINVASIHSVWRDRISVKLIGAGYGRTESGELPDKLQFAAVFIGSHFCADGKVAGSYCEAFREFVLSDAIVPSSGHRADSCGGDSGAPIFWQAPNQTDGTDEASPTPGRVMLVGITSRALLGVAHNPGTLCGGGGIYTNIGHPDVIKWLSQFGVHPETDLGFRAKEK